MNKSFARGIVVSFLATLLVALGADPCVAQTTRETRPGHVFEKGSWKTPEQVAVANQRNDVLSEYELRRAETPDTFEGQVQMAHWCKTRSLHNRRKAHLKRALSHDPGHQRVHKQLGHIHRYGQWYSPRQVETQENEFLAARQRYRDWRERVRRIARQLKSRSERQQQMGAESLREITDPRSVTALEIVLAPVNESMACKALDTIHRFPHREATESIARIALLNPHETASAQALDLLAQRNRYDFLPGLIGGLVSPVSARISISPTANGNVLHQVVLFQQNMDADVIQQIDSWMVQNPTNTSLSRQGDMIREAGRRAMVADAEIRQVNDVIHKRNSLIQHALRHVTDADPGETPEDWWRWWNDENEIYASARPVEITHVKPVEVTSSPRIPSGGECLVAGTSIWTDMGPRPVETIQVGDRVLCQNLESGSLEFQTVLYPTQRPKTPTFRIRLTEETIQASGGHLFWVADRGFTKARDLRAGQSLKTADGSEVEIKHIEASGSFLLYNLVVDANANYFVGRHKVLSHDSTILARGESSVETGR